MTAIGTWAGNRFIPNRIAAIGVAVATVKTATTLGSARNEFSLGAFRAFDPGPDRLGCLAFGIF